MSTASKDYSSIDNGGLYPDITDCGRIDRENIARQDYEVGEFPRSDRALHVVGEFRVSRAGGVGAHRLVDADLLLGYPAVGVFAVQSAAGHSGKDALHRVKRGDGPIRAESEPHA